MSNQPAAGSAPARPQRRRALIIAIVGVVVAAVVVGGVLGYVALRPQLSGQHPASLSTPSQVAGLELSTEPVLEAAAAQMAAAISEHAQLEEAVAGFYLDPAADDRLVMMAGGTARLPDPQARLDAAFQGTSEGGLPVTGLSGIDPGPLGGTAQCGEADAEGVPVAVCGWADHGSLVLVVFFNRPVDDSAALLRDIRAESLER